VVDPLNPIAAAEALVCLLRHPAQVAEMGRNVIFQSTVGGL
jgi:hypothetical protein